MSAAMPAIIGAAMLVPPTAVHPPDAKNVSPTPALPEMSGTPRHVAHVAFFASGCHFGRLKTVDWPPPPAWLPPAAHESPARPPQSFHTGSTPGSSSAVPPTPVTNGSLAGLSTWSASLGGTAVPS